MEEKQLTNWQVVGIGVRIGIIPAIVFFVLDFPFFDTILIGVMSIIFGVAGALVGRFMIKTQRATWIGAVLGTVMGAGGCYVFIMIIFLMTQ